MSKNWDVIIIGGGLAGYVAANSLANKNLSVLVLEKSTRTGGRAGTNKINEHYFNLGPHALYKKGKAMSALKSFGINLHGQTPKLDGLLTEEDQSYIAPFTPKGIFSTQYLNWNERFEWLKIIVKIKSLNTNAVNHLTFQQWVEQSVQAQQVQILLYALSRLASYCHAPEKLSASTILHHIKTVLGGVLYIDYGWQSIIDQLHNKAIMSDVHVKTEMLVKQILRHHNNSYSIVLSDGEVLKSKYVIYTGSPVKLHSLLVSELNLPNSCFPSLSTVRGASLDIALSKLTEPMHVFALGLSKPLYYSVHSNYAKLSDNEKSIVLHVFKYYHPDETIDNEQIKKELEQYLEALQPNWRQYLISSRFIPQITVNQRLPQLGEDHYLNELKLSIPGFYIAGDWACPQSILAEGAVSSAIWATDHIIQKEKW